MWIALDAMGGDFAPAIVVDGAVDAARRDGAKLFLVGIADQVKIELARHGGDFGDGEIEVIHAPEVVTMDDPPIAPLRKKRRSSLRVCAELVKEGRAVAMVSMGNTGAAMVAAKTVIRTVPGVDRPALAAVFPTATGRTVVLDVGANVDTKPAHLRQFAVMGHFYAQEVIGRKEPRIGLLSVGAEEGKGTELTKAVYKVLKEAGLNFVGNVEGRDIFNGNADVIVCDGFVGNVVLKSSEALVSMVGKMLREEIDCSLRTRVGGLLVKPAFDGLRERVDYRAYGAAPLLGLEGGCFIGHGSSDEHAIRNAIARAVEFGAAEVHRKIREKVAVLHLEEERLLEPVAPAKSIVPAESPSEAPVDASSGTKKA